jgi:hypothetical protein
MMNYEELSRYRGLLYGAIDISRAHNYKMKQPIDSGVAYNYVRIPVSVVIRFKFFIHHIIDNDVRPIPLVSLSSLERLEVTERILNEFK